MSFWLAYDVVICLSGSNGCSVNQRTAGGTLDEMDNWMRVMEVNV